MAYDHHVSRFQPPASEDGASIEDQIQDFDEKIGQCVAAETIAMEKFRATMIARGMDPDAKPELSPELQAKMERDAMTSDTDVFFSGLEGEIRGRQLKGKDYEFYE